MRAVDVSDRALTKYFANKRSSWQDYKSRTDANSLAYNLCRVHHIIQDSIVDSLQCAGPGTLLLQLVGLPGRFGKDATLGDEDNMFPRKLLFQLAD